MSNQTTKRINKHHSSDQRIKMIAICGMLAALAYVITFVCRLPIIPGFSFLELEFKSAIILIGGFIYGPLAGFAISAVVCFLEMLTFSHTGFIGFIMNLLATTAFVCPAAFIYKRKRSLVSAVIGIAVGTLSMTLAMVLWNYLITPIYMPFMTREEITKLLLPVFVPFNLIKGALNASATLLLYKFVVSALRKANLLPKGESHSTKRNSTFIASILISVIVIAGCTLAILAFNNII